MIIKKIMIKNVLKEMIVVIIKKVLEIIVIIKNKVIV